MIFRNSEMRCLIAKVKNIWGMEEDLEEKIKLGITEFKISVMLLITNSYYF